MRINSPTVLLDAKKFLSSHPGETAAVLRTRAKYLDELLLNPRADRSLINTWAGLVDNELRRLKGHA
jgi:hypothetical protein